MKKHQSGFTLIEIAIVLVIIGLLLGGVLKGQELIDSARTRSLINKIDGISAAWYAFQDRYRNYPGDMRQADCAAQIDGACAFGGDANGTIQTNNERGAVWEHLSRAGLITGNYNTAPTGSNFDCQAGVVCPENGFGMGILITFDNERLPAGGNVNEMLSDGIPSKILAEMDRKTDDGRNDSGDMSSADGGAGVSNTCNSAPAYTLNIESCGAVWTVL